MLQVIDKIHPDTVNWRRTNTKQPLGHFKALENTNQVINFGKDLRFSLVGIQGADITDKNRTLVLGRIPF